MIGDEIDYVKFIKNEMLDFVLVILEIFDSDVLCLG